MMATATQHKTNANEDELHRVAMSDPLVYSFLSRFPELQTSYTAMLQDFVIAMAQRHKAAMEQIKSLMQNMPVEVRT